MDPGPFEISLYLESENIELGEPFNGLAFLVSAKYVSAARTKGWRMTKRLIIHLNTYEDDVVWKTGVVSMRHKFSPMEFLSVPEEAREQVVLDIIHQCVTRCCASAFDWPFASFARAYAKVRAEKGDLVREVRLIRSPDRKHYASVVVALNQRNAIISARFFDKHKVAICDVELIRTFRGPYLYSEILRRMEWKDANTFGIGNKSGELRLEASLMTRTMTVRLDPQKSTVEELEGLLRICTYRQFASDAERIAWANR